MVVCCQLVGWLVVCTIVLLKNQHLSLSPSGHVVFWFSEGLLLKFIDFYNAFVVGQAMS